jgi:hypothetical protein
MLWCLLEERRVNTKLLVASKQNSFPRWMASALVKRGAKMVE